MAWEIFSVFLGVAIVSALGWVVYTNRKKREAEPAAPPHSLPPDGDPGVVPGNISIVTALTSPAAVAIALGVGGSGGSGQTDSRVGPKDQSGPGLVDPPV